MRYPTDRRRTQCDRILALLRERGQAGALNVELYKICFRVSSRIHELRARGVVIEVRREGAGLFRYVLISEPAAPKRYAEREREMHDQHAPLFAATTERP